MLSQKCVFSEVTEIRSGRKLRCGENPGEDGSRDEIPALLDLLFLLDHEMTQDLFGDHTNY